MKPDVDAIAFKVRGPFRLGSCRLQQKESDMLWNETARPLKRSIKTLCSDLFLRAKYAP